MAWLPNTDQLPRLWKFLRPYWLYWIVGAVSTVSTSVLAAMIPRRVGLAIDHIKNGLDSRVADIKIILILAAAAAIVGFCQRRFVIGASRKIERDLHNSLFRKLLSLPSSYYDKMQTGDIMARMTNDLNQVRMLAGPGFMYPASAVTTFVTVFIFMYRLSPSLTAYAFVVPIIALVSTNRLTKLLHEKFLSVHEQYSLMTSRIQEALSGIQIVRAYNCQDRETDRLRELSDDYLNKNLSYFKIMGTLHPIFGMGHALGLLVVLWVGGRYTIDGRISIGDFAQYILYLRLLSWPMIAMGWILNVIQRGMTAMGRLAEIFDAQSDIVEPRDPVEIQKVEGKIEFKGLTFGYRASPVLKNIDLIVPAKSTLGIVGPVGCGKSTLIRLISRQYPVNPHQLFIDDIDINDLPVGQVRRNVSVVAQDSFLFSNSLAQNIAFGLPEVDPERVQWASSISRIDKDFDELPDREKTLLGERGVTLSSGQRQRTAIARALAVEAPILLLDDCLSAVDTRTEAEILERIKPVLKTCTAVIVAHRLSAVAHCDQIIYLEDGEIVERGSHEELIELNGRYARVHEQQLLEEQIESLE